MHMSSRDRHNQHGWQEHRSVETFDITGQLDHVWQGLIVQGARVHRLTRMKQLAKGRWRERCEASFYVCQIQLAAADFAEAVRAHWTVENRNHHGRDATVGEDHSRIRVQPAPFTRIRSSASIDPNLRLFVTTFFTRLPCKAPGKQSIRLRRKCAAWDDDFLASLVTP